MYSLPVITWIRFLAWLDIGLLIYYFYSRTHSRIADKVERTKTFSWKDMLEFFGIFAFINGFLFGILSTLVISGATSMKSWNEINLDPRHTLAVCSLLLVIGIAMFLTGRLGKKNNNK
jgi:hypothetical protein